MPGPRAPKPDMGEQEEGHRSWLGRPRTDPAPNWGHLEVTWRQEGEKRGAAGEPVVLSGWQGWPASYKGKQHRILSREAPLRRPVSQSLLGHRVETEEGSEEGSQEAGRP